MSNFPQKPFESLLPFEKDTIRAKLQQSGRTKTVFNAISVRYLKFIVDELKPFVDSAYSTLPDLKNTFIAGASMGGLISMYAICEYPNVFGGAACLSTHWPGIFSMTRNPIPDAFIKYMAEHLPDPKNHRFYFDCGDQTLDAMYPPLQSRVDSVMKVKGYSIKNWETKYFPAKITVRSPGANDWRCLCYFCLKIDRSQYAHLLACNTSLLKTTEGWGLFLPFWFFEYWLV